MTEYGVLLTCAASSVIVECSGFSIANQVAWTVKAAQPSIQVEIVHRDGDGPWLSTAPWLSETVEVAADYDLIRTGDVSDRNRGV